MIIIFGIYTRCQCAFDSQPEGLGVATGPGLGLIMYILSTLEFPTHNLNFQCCNDIVMLCDLRVYMLLIFLLAFLRLDVSDIKFVINVDYPSSSEDYIHRIGRTARSDRHGTAYTFFTNANAKQAKDLISVLREANQQVNDKLLELMGMARNFGGKSRFALRTDISRICFNAHENNGSKSSFAMRSQCVFCYRSYPGLDFKPFVLIEANWIIILYNYIV